MKKRYFGTDGIRGEVGQGVINPAFVLKLGWALGQIVARTTASSRGKVIIGKDTRISGYMFEAALEAGLVSAGVNVRMLGPMPTPAIAYLTRTFQADAGIVISASHNAYNDNGIKFFSMSGCKLPDDIEAAIEDELEKDMQCVPSRQLGKVRRIVDAPGRYIEYCKHTLPMSFSLAGMKIVIDCAHGATYHVGPRVFNELGAKVIAIGDDPDGFNINEGFGSTAPQALQQKVLVEKADLGIAFDGDGDRVLFVDCDGQLVDGDELLYIIACDQQRNNRCEGVVGTQMSNLGFEQALNKLGIDFVRAKVGDRYVKALMEEKGWTLGGENSGHIICSDVTTTGDGIIAALKILFAIVKSGKTLKQLREDLVMFPQVMVNVRVDANTKIDLDHPDIVKAVKDAENALADKGRVLLRLSGTEPLVRVMVEGEDSKKVKALANSIANVVKQAL